MIEHVGARTREDWRELYAGEEDPFGAADADAQWRSKTHYTLLVVDGRTIATVGLVVVDVEAGAEAFAVVGVGGVIVTRPERGKGRLRPTLEAALERAATFGPERAMLFCSPDKARIYARFGFREIAAPVRAAQLYGEILMPDVAMWRPLREGATWPEGDVRLPGLPF